MKRRKYFFAQRWKNPWLLLLQSFHVTCLPLLPSIHFSGNTTLINNNGKMLFIECRMLYMYRILRINGLRAKKIYHSCHLCLFYHALLISIFFDFYSWESFMYITLYFLFFSALQQCSLCLCCGVTKIGVSFQSQSIKPVQI